MKTLAKDQRGIGFSGFIVIAMVVVLAAIMGMKLIPAYVKSAQITEIFKEIVRDPAMQNAPIKDIQMSFIRRAEINNIRDVSVQDVEISKDSGQLTISTSYTVRIPLAGNATLLLDFNPSSS
jgi:hypothetical protein